MDDQISIEGWAHPDGGTGSQVTQVQLSFDNGATWQDASTLEMEQKRADAKVFSWTLWQHRISLQQAKEYANDGNITVKVRAIAKDGTI